MKEPNEALAPEAPPGTPEANLSGPAKPEKSPLLREVRSLAVRLAVFAAVLWVLLTQVYLVTQASGNEMFPAVKDGDLVLGIRLEKDYAKNDVVVYERSGRLRVGRVLARGGDIVTLSESGVVEVNGSAQGGGILYPPTPNLCSATPTLCRRTASSFWATAAHRPRTAVTSARCSAVRSRQKSSPSSGGGGSEPPKTIQDKIGGTLG